MVNKTVIKGFMTPSGKTKKYFMIFSYKKYALVWSTAILYHEFYSPRSHLRHLVRGRTSATLSEVAPPPACPRSHLRHLVRGRTSDSHLGLSRSIYIYVSIII
jgi:hypothetical protein